MVVLIDSSYFNFYRFFATVRWYNYDPDRVETAKNVAWLDNPIFMKTFEKMWFETIAKIRKKYGDKIIFARDGKNVWRYDIYPEYKGSRQKNNDDIHSPGPVFKYVNKNYHNRLEYPVIRVDTAEADDIIAITTRYFQNEFPSEKIIIITGDHDLLQLSNVQILNLKFKEITSDPYISLMIKILAGDPSDNIPPIYKGCGKKTAERLANNSPELEKILNKHGREQYILNRTLVDFDYIPISISSEIEKILDILTN